MVLANHHVLWLQVTMSDPCFVCGVKSGNDLDRHIEDVNQLQSSAGKMLPQCDAVDVFSRDEGSGIRLAKLIDGQDVWVIEIRDRARFLCETLQSIFVLRNGKGKEFKCDCSTE